MARTDDQTTPPLSNRLHHRVRLVAVLLTIWFALVAWAFFGSGYAGVVLAMVNFFILVVLVLLYALWRIGQGGAGAQDDPDRRASFLEWMAGDFDTWQARLHARDAMIQILLPIVAGALGMTLFAVVLHVATGT